MAIRETLTIGVRGSRLSLAQANTVLALIRAEHPALRVDIQVITTTGDRLLETPLPLIGGKGIFTEEIEQALLSDDIDLATHSLKDLPVQQRSGLVIGAVTRRASVTDVLISRNGELLDELPGGARVGTSSLRRSAQLKMARPDLEPVSIRGNVETRLRKLMDQAHNYDAIVLARAGLERLDLLATITEELSLDVMLPAPGQGALAVECRDEPGILEILYGIDHRPSRLTTTAERAFLAGLGGGCATPVAAYGVFDGDELRLRGRVVSLNGRTAIDVEAGQRCETIPEAVAAGSALAWVAIERGAAELVGAAV